MTKNKEELISNQTFHFWKNHDCTKALIKILNDSIECGKEEIYQTVIKNDKIPIDKLNAQKGALKEDYELLLCIEGENAKSLLESKLEEEYEEISK